MTLTDPIANDEAPAERRNKSRLKRDAQALQDMGSELLRLSNEQLDQLGLPAALLEAVRHGKSLKQDGSLKRQRKYIGKLLRQDETASIRAKLDEIHRASAATVRALHRIEEWRERLLAEGDSAIAALLAEFPQADRPKLRRLITTAREEMERGQAPRSARLLFRYLRDLLGDTP